MSDDRSPAANAGGNRPRPADAASGAGPESGAVPSQAPLQSRELGGPKEPEPTRYGDWERNGRCSDF